MDPCFNQRLMGGGKENTKNKRKQLAIKPTSHLNGLYIYYLEIGSYWTFQNLYWAGTRGLDQALPVGSVFAKF